MARRKYAYLNMSKSLAQKLDGLTDEEWAELTRCLTEAIGKAAADKGIRIVPQRQGIGDRHRV